MLFLTGQCKGPVTLKVHRANLCPSYITLFFLLEIWQSPDTLKFSTKICFLTLCLPPGNPPCATLFWSALELGHQFWKYYSQLAVSFFNSKCMENQKAKLITYAHSANQKQWESLHWAIWINNRRAYNCADWRTWHLTDVQIGERGKQS